MIRNSSLIDRLPSAKSVGAVLLALGALVLPACGVGQEEGGGLGEEGLGEEDGLGEERLGDD